MQYKTNIKDVYIIHENKISRHFDAVFFLASEGRIRLRGFYAFSLPNFENTIKGILLIRIKLLYSEIKKLVDIMRIFFLLFKKNKLIILGMAPFDWHVIFFGFLKKRHRVILFTSWPYWDGQKVPKSSSEYVKKLWFTFLNNLDVVTVTKKASFEIMQYRARPKVIPHCIDVKIFQPVQQKQKNKMICLYVGRFAREKGISIILNIIEKYLKNREIEFWFVGDGPLKKNIQESANNSKQIKYLGYLQDKALQQAYQKSDFLILPSYALNGWEELFGIVIIESFASGVPVIATDCTGPKEIVEDGLNGFIVRQNDEMAIVDKIMYFMNNRDRLYEMGRISRKTAELKYDVRKCSVLWEELLFSKMDTN